MKETWFVTGSSVGLGRSIAEAALAEGRDVVASARCAGGTDCKEPCHEIDPCRTSCSGHGIDRGARGNSIHLSLVREGESLLFTTENQLPADPAATNKPGSGLQNLEKRLNLLYGDRFVLTTTRTATHFQAYLKIPLI